MVLAYRTESFGDIVATGFTSPLFNHLTGVIVRLLGTDAFVGQVLPFVAGSVLSGLVFWLLQAFGLSRLAALSASLLVILSPVSVLYSTRVKPYTGEALVCAVLLFLALRLVYGRGSPVIFGGIAAIGVLWSATVAITALSAFSAVFLVRSIDTRRVDLYTLPWLICAVAVSGAYWGLYLRHAATNSLISYWEDSMLRSDSPFDWVAAVLSKTEVLAEVLLPFPGELGCMILAVAALVLMVCRWRKAAVLLAPFAATVLASSVGLMPYGGGRTDLHLLGASVSIVAFALHEMNRNARWKGTLAAAGLISTTLLIGTVRYEHPRYNKQDIRPLIELIEARAASNDAVIVYPSARYAFALYTSAPIEIVAANDHPNGFTIDVTDPSITVLVPSVQDPDAYDSAVESAAAGYDSIWYIGTFFKNDDKAIISRIESLKFVEQERFDTSGARLIYFARS